MAVSKGRAAKSRSRSKSARSGSRASSTLAKRKMNRVPQRKPSILKKSRGAKPRYFKMIEKGIRATKMKKASCQQLLKYIMANYNVGNNRKVVDNKLRFALRAAVSQGRIRQTAGKDWGNFTLSNEKRVTLQTPDTKKRGGKSRGRSQSRRRSSSKRRSVSRRTKKRSSSKRRGSMKRRSQGKKRTVKRINRRSKSKAKSGRRRH